jgi:hypothetical protein
MTASPSKVPKRKFGLERSPDARTRQIQIRNRQQQLHTAGGGNWQVSYRGRAEPPETRRVFGGSGLVRRVVRAPTRHFSGPNLMSRVRWKCRCSLLCALPMVDTRVLHKISPVDSMAGHFRSLVLPCGIAIFLEEPEGRAATYNCNLPLQPGHIENDCGQRWPAWIARPGAKPTLPPRLRSARRRTRPEPVQRRSARQRPPVSPTRWHRSRRDHERDQPGVDRHRVENLPHARHRVGGEF